MTTQFNRLDLTSTPPIAKEGYEWKAQKNGWIQKKIVTEEQKALKKEAKKASKQVFVVPTAPQTSPAINEMEDLKKQISELSQRLNTPVIKVEEVQKVVEEPKKTQRPIYDNPLLNKI